MTYQDRVYGKIEVDDPVLQDLIASPTLIRLKGISQAGYQEPFFPGTEYSRFDHSVGVMALLRRYGAPLEEQIAGLIHDVSHSVFSHVIDYVLDAGSQTEQSHQDNIHDAFVRRSDIPGILARHGVETEYILDERHFPLKEQPLPDLCADRIDYTLRNLPWIPDMPVAASSVLQHLRVRNERWLFDTVDAAVSFAELFRTLNTRYYTSFEKMVNFRTLADYLRYALKRRYMSEADLYTTDDAVLAKIDAHLPDDPHLRMLSRQKENRVAAVHDPTQYDARISCKSRVIDPPFLGADGTIRRLSEARPAWAAVVREESKPKEYFIRFLASW
ncbi:MAG: HD domain-containing protein [Candidatus Kerfeldbacteria bacterium]|nr:HD domain-containing protein [Candidatus Kerfeldbacteria bacterium]